MSETSTQRELFSDFSALLSALLPDARGFLFHDRKMRLYWRNEMAEIFEPSKEYQIALLQTLKHGEILGEQDKVPLGDDAAFIFQLLSDSGWSLGAVSVIVNGELAGKSREWIETQIAPALHTLQRELGLRYRLVRTHRRMEEKTSDHKFLRQLGEWSRADVACEAALESILSCCAEHLKSEAVSLLVPDKRIEMHIGKAALEPREAIMLIANHNETLSIGTQPEVRTFKQTSSGSYHCSVLQDKRFPVGLLSICGPADEDYIERLNDIAEALAASIEYVIERDFDALTGLPRWAVFEAQLRDACEQDDGSHVIMYFDIDRMKLVNDTVGRSVGDDMVREFANILRLGLKDHLITRVAGNNFAALLHGISIQQAEALGGKICAEFKACEYNFEGKQLTPTVSIGVAPLVVTDEGVRAALTPAQVACEAAKDRGRGRVETYQSADESIVKRLDDIQIIGAVRSALSDDRLDLYAQPLSSVHKGGTNQPYFEVLVRMLDENGEPMPPAQFMSAAERFQIMPDLDLWVVDKTISILEAQKSEHGRRPHIAINLSGQSLGNNEFIGLLRDRLNGSIVSPEQICFEITESVAVANLKQAQDFVNEFKSMGCKFSLDDFGTGLSSFSYLKLFPVDTLKIDGSFIEDIETNEISRSMVTAISEIAKVMELETVAEYVQNKASANILRDMGIGWLQGHYVGKPKPLVDYLSGSNNAKVHDCSALDGEPTVKARALPDDFLPELALHNMRIRKS